MKTYRPKFNATVIAYLCVMLPFYVGFFWVTIFITRLSIREFHAHDAKNPLWSILLLLGGFFTAFGVWTYGVATLFTWEYRLEINADELTWTHVGLLSGTTRMRVEDLQGICLTHRESGVQRLILYTKKNTSRTLRAILSEADWNDISATIVNTVDTLRKLQPPPTQSPV